MLWIWLLLLGFATERHSCTPASPAKEGDTEKERGRGRERWHIDNWAKIEDKAKITPHSAYFLVSQQLECLLVSALSFSELAPGQLSPLHFAIQLRSVFLVEYHTAAQCEIKISRIENRHFYWLSRWTQRSLPFKKEAVIQCWAASKLSALISLQYVHFPMPFPGAFGPTVMKKAGRELTVRFA